MLKKLDIGTSEIEQVEAFNALVDAVNELHEEAENNARIRADHEHKIEALQDNQNTYWIDVTEIKKELQTRAENVQKDTESRSENVQEPCYKSITFMSNGHNRVFYGHDSIVELEQPLPKGTLLTIKSYDKGE